MKGLVIAAATSGAGKTTLTLGLLRALRNRGLRVRAAKSGPDYGDPGFHLAASGAASVNLDAWAMTPADLRARAAAQSGDFLLVEGAMGVLDGARGGGGSAADLARVLGLPVVLVIDIARQGASAALSAAGLRALAPDLSIAGVILNRAGSDAHAALAAEPLRKAGFTVWGALPRDAELALPDRHLGLVQAGEIAALEPLLERAARACEAALDLDALYAGGAPLAGLAPGAAPDGAERRFAPLASHIAVARDEAFAFAYPHMLADWRRAGAEISFFSPLANEPPAPEAGAIFLPGGYPELHAPRLAAAGRFRRAMHRAAEDGAVIYGECGGYMVLGEALEDAQGISHPMLGLLPLSTAFARPQRILGYRQLRALPGGVFNGSFRAHEFHYATITSEAPGAADGRLFEACDATGAPCPPMGLRRGRVAGSFAHLIAPQ